MSRYRTSAELSRIARDALDKLKQERSDAFGIPDIGLVGALERIADVESTSDTTTDAARKEAARQSPQDIAVNALRYDGSYEACTGHYRRALQRIADVPNRLMPLTTALRRAIGPLSRAQSRARDNANNTVKVIDTLRDALDDAEGR